MPWTPHTDKDNIVLEHSTKLQWITDKLDDHEHKFIAGNERFTKQETLSAGILKSLKNINDSLNKAKWAFVGAVIVFLFQQFGILTVVKMWLHITG